MREASRVLQKKNTATQETKRVGRLGSEPTHQSGRLTHQTGLQKIQFANSANYADAIFKLPKISDLRWRRMITPNLRWRTVITEIPEIYSKKGNFGIPKGHIYSKLIL
jgi:hypothetical protein